jgi:predicted DNA-binding transcriptional regulator AlpA
MLKNVIKQLLTNIIDDIDTGNSNVSEEQEMEIIESIKKFTDRTERLSKCQACRYLNISRASFDNYVKEGKIVKGVKVSGFNELSWSKKDLDDYLNVYKKKDKK